MFFVVLPSQTGVLFADPGILPIQNLRGQCFDPKTGQTRMTVSCVYRPTRPHQAGHWWFCWLRSKCGATVAEAACIFSFYWDGEMNAFNPLSSTAELCVVQTLELQARRAGVSRSNWGLFLCKAAITWLEWLRYHRYPKTPRIDYYLNWIKGVALKISIKHPDVVNKNQSPSARQEVPEAFAEFIEKLELEI